MNLKKGIKGLLIGVGALGTLTTAATILYRKTANSFAKMALEREPKTDRNMQKMANRVSGGDGKDEETKQLVNEAIERLKDEPIETVEMESFDGLKMIGHWYPCDNAKRIIVAMHGWRSTWLSDFAIISEFWHNNGCSILFAEQRGQGESDGDYIGFGLAERHDCIEWVKWVNANIGDELPIYLCGLSMGASTVLMASSLPKPDNVHGIMADCGFTSPHAIGKYVTENNLHFSYSPIGKAVDDIFKHKIQIETSNYSTVDAMKENTLPILFVHGTDDRFVPVEMTYENYKACTAPKRLLIVPGAGHARSYLTQKELYQKAVLDFWNEFDGNKTEE